MEILNKNQIEKGAGIASYELRQDLLNIIKDDDIIINLAYTDYGGDFLDKVIIAYFKENYSDNSLIESTKWNGENCFIYGEVAKEFIKQSENYILGFENIEDFHSTMQYKQEIEDFKYFLNEIKGTFIFDYEKALDYLMENKSGYYNITPQGLDFCYDDLIRELLKENIIVKQGQELYYLFIENNYSPDIAEYYVNCYENKTIIQLCLNEQTLSIINQYENSLK